MTETRDEKTPALSIAGRLYDVVEPTLSDWAGLLDLMTPEDYAAVWDAVEAAQKAAPQAAEGDLNPAMVRDVLDRLLPLAARLPKLAERFALACLRRTDQSTPYPRMTATVFAQVVQAVIEQNVFGDLADLAKNLVSLVQSRATAAASAGQGSGRG